MTAKKTPLRLPKILRILQARLKLVISAAIGIGVIFLLPPDWRLATRSLVGWDIGISIYLCIVYWTFLHSEVSHIKRHAAAEDEGRSAILVLTVTATLASIGAIVALLGHGGGQGNGQSPPTQLIFAVATILLSWTFIHSIFALHYAHEFYLETPPASGLKFPGSNQPDYWDFVYFSFVIGMTCQVSDVAVTSRKIRHAVAAHGIVAFLYNVALLAITVNIGASAI